MKKDNKFTEYFKKITETEASLRRVPKYFFVICVVMILIFGQLVKTNDYLKTIAENTARSNSVKETFVEEVTETEKTIEDFIPILEEISRYEEENSTTIFYHNTDDNEETSSVETTTKRQTNSNTSNASKNETTTKKETTTKSSENNAKSKTYVINTNSKKIHYADCTFAERTKEENKKTVKLTDDELKSYLNNGYTFCKTCGGN